jgi:hypothetical protein
MPSGTWWAQLVNPNHVSSGTAVITPRWLYVLAAATPQGLKDGYKEFNASGQGLIDRLQTLSSHGIHVLGSFIFGLPTDRPETFETTADVAQSAGLTFAQFVTLTPFPGTGDFGRREKLMESDPRQIEGNPWISRRARSN